LFWDGRRSALETQATDPLLNFKEHGLKKVDAVLSVIRHDVGYRSAFENTFKVHGKQINIDHVAYALAAFERTLLAGDSTFDRYQYGNDKSALSNAAVRGLALFQELAQCQNCHVIGEHTAMLTDLKFHSLGVGLRRIESRLAVLTQKVVQVKGSALDQLVSKAPEIAELGRFLVTRQPKDIGSFKTPSLRNVALTAPYMHDGSVMTLEEAIDREIYYRSLESERPLVLTREEKLDLLGFLKSLTSPRYEQAGNVKPLSNN
jgi:cytochrome c peroxidase